MNIGFQRTNVFIAHRRKDDGQEQMLETHLNEVGEIASRLAIKMGVSNVI